MGFLQNKLKLLKYLIWCQSHSKHSIKMYFLKKSMLSLGPDYLEIGWHLLYIYILIKMSHICMYIYTHV